MAHLLSGRRWRRGRTHRRPRGGGSRPDRRFACSVEHHEHGPLVEVEGVEPALAEHTRARFFQALVGERTVVAGFGLRGRGDLVSVARESPMVGGRTIGKTEEPRSNRARSVVVVEVAEHGDEHVVGDVLHLRAGDPEPAQRGLHVVCVCVVDRTKCRNFQRIRHQRRAPSTSPKRPTTGAVSHRLAPSMRRSTRERGT